MVCAGMGRFFLISAWSSRGFAWSSADTGKQPSIKSLLSGRGGGEL